MNWDVIEIVIERVMTIINSVMILVGYDWKWL